MAHAIKNPAMAIGKHAALLAYLSVALFPLYWLIKIAVTPDRSIFTDGTRMWPSQLTLDNFRLVIFQTDFLSYFTNSLYVSLGTAALTMIIAPIYKIVALLGLLNSLTSLIVVQTAFNIAFATFLLQSFFDGIPKNLEEAVMMEGCTRIQALRKVIFPLTLPGLGATLGFVFTAAWSELLFALMLISNNDAMTFPVGLLTFVSRFSID